MSGGTLLRHHRKPPMPQASRKMATTSDTMVVTNESSFSGLLFWFDELVGAGLFALVLATVLTAVGLGGMPLMLLCWPVTCCVIIVLAGPDGLAAAVVARGIFVVFGVSFVTISATVGGCVVAAVRTLTVLVTAASVLTVVVVVTVADVVVLTVVTVVVVTVVVVVVLVAVVVVTVVVYAGSVNQDMYDIIHAVLALQYFLPCTWAPWQAASV